jgi:hypothetical protein
MASPFRAFRKNQKALMAVAGVAIIFVFVLGDSLSQLGGGGGPSEGGLRPNDVAVRWNGGKLTNAELNHLVVQRLVVNNFLRTVEGVGIQAIEETGAQPQPLRVARMLGPERPEQGVEDNVVQTYLMAEAARKAGMAIGDDYIVNYLLQLGRGFVSVDTVRQIIMSREVGGRQHSVDYVMDALRHEMLARNYLASYYYALETELPEDRWKDWRRVNDRVVVEAVAVPAESLLVDVKDPTDEALLAYFEEYKNREPMPDTSWGIELPSPNPAFKIPQKVAVQFLKADYNEFLAKVEEEVTDKEIEKFYGDNKDPNFIRADSLLGAPDSLIGSGGEEEAKAGDANGEAEAADDAAGADAAQPAESDESSITRSSPFRLTAFQEEAEDEAPSDAPSEEPTTDAAADGSPEEVAAPPTEAALEFQPLEQVRDEIRRVIAEAKVSEQLAEMFSALDAQVDESYTTYFGAIMNAEDAGKEPPPPPEALADLSPLANKNGLAYEKTEPATWQQLRDTTIGNSTKPEWAGTPFYAAILSPDYELYEPVTTQDLDANRYLSMKTADIPGKVPTLEEVRDKVLKAWKLREAGKLALKRAEEIATDAKEKGGSLTDAISGDSRLSIVKTDPFSFLTVGTVSRETQQVQSFRLSEPDGIVAAGPDFMEQVFSLQDGEVAGVANHDGSVAYAVRIAQHLDSSDELRQAFLMEDYNWYGTQLMARGHFRTALRAVVADFFESADVEWERAHDQVIRPGETAKSEADES